MSLLLDYRLGCLFTNPWIGLAMDKEPFVALPPIDVRCAKGNVVQIGPPRNPNPEPLDQHHVGKVPDDGGGLGRPRLLALSPVCAPRSRLAPPRLLVPGL